MAQTALAEALARKGFIQRNVDLSIAIAKFQNAGGDYGSALAILNSAYGRGPPPAAVDAPKAEANGEGAAAATPHPVGHNSSRFKPGHARRSGARLAAVNARLSRSLFESIVLPDGRALGAVRWSECETLSRRYHRFGHLLTACRNYAIPPDPLAALVDIVPEKELKRIVARVDGEAAP